MPDLPFATLTELQALVDAYFVFIGGEYHLEDTAGAVDSEENVISKKIWDREPVPATFSELACFLGFSSRKEFDEYTQNGSFARELARAQLRVEMAYEKQLQNQLSTGAMFALRSRGWHEKAKDTVKVGERSGTLNVNVIESGPRPVGNEQEIVL